MESGGTSDAPKLLQRLAKQLEPSADVIFSPLRIKGRTAYLLYLKSVVDGIQLQSNVIKPFFELPSERHFAAYITSLPYKVELPDEQKLLTELTKGHVLVAVNQQVTLLELKFVAVDAVQDAIIEPTIYGPQLGLSESLETNINILRQRYHQSSLVVETVELKDSSNRSIAILYDERLVKSHVLQAIQTRLQKVDQLPLIYSSGDLQNYLNNKKYTLFPTSLLTERPDRIIHNITGGKVIIIADGSPEVVVSPVVFMDFMVSMEDVYHTFWNSTLGMALRYGGLFTCLMLPALYVAVISYTPRTY